MRSHGLGLKGKFMLALLVSAALPFLIGLVTFETTGFRYFLDERGKFHQIQATHLARSLAQAADAHADVLQTWTAADPALFELIVAQNREVAGIPSAELAREAERIDEIWPSMPDDEPMLAAILHNPASLSLRRFTAMHPEVAEIIATDANGHLVAASGRTSDYNQADEEWWWEGSALPKHGRWSEHPRYDASSGVYSIDVVFPMHDDGELVGVVKLSADVSTMFTRLGDGLDDRGRWRIVLADGHVLACSEPDFTPLGEKVTPPTLEHMRSGRSHWFLEQDATGQAWMTGITALQETGHLHGAFVLFSSLRDDAVAPLQRRFLQIGALAVTMLGLCTFIGFGVLRKNILLPLATLGRVSRLIAESTRLLQPAVHDQAAARRERQAAIEDLRRIEAIGTGDEIEELAADFAEMGTCVIRYQEELEKRIRSETPDAPGETAPGINPSAGNRES